VHNWEKRAAKKGVGKTCGGEGRYNEKGCTPSKTAYPFKKPGWGKLGGREKVGEGQGIKERKAQTMKVLH